MDGNRRDNTWLNQANLLFVDHPVGCGYSFVTNGGKFTRNSSMITAEFVVAMKMFLHQ